MRQINYNDVIKNDSRYILVDVRCPREYEKETIPGSYNIPLFSDEEYETVGTIYKTHGKRDAVLKGLSYVEKKLTMLYERFYELYQRDKEIVVFCARGGMRSTSVVNFIVNFSLPVVKLEGGYKNYRKHVLENLPELFLSKEYISIYGNTGCGKTLILKRLQSESYDVLDLEGCANHRGSLLGSIGLGKQSSQKMFESLVYDSLRKSKGNVIYTEGESRRIGYIIMPQYMFDKLSSATKITVSTSIENRVKIIADDYIESAIDNDEIIETLYKMEKYISKNILDGYAELIRKNEYQEVIRDLIVNYYDKRYKNDTDGCETIYFETIDECVNIIKNKAV